MDTNSSNNSSSSYCFLFELCARKPASLGAIGHGDNGGVFNLGSPIFETIFGAFFFSENGAKWSPGWLQKCNKICKTTILETKPTKHVENMLNLISSYLQETRFRIERLPRITKTRGADKYKKRLMKCIEMQLKFIKKQFRTQPKTMLKDRTPKIKKYRKNDSQMIQKSACILGKCLLAHLWLLEHFL